MPIYDYECKCGHTGEYITSMDANKRCPDCKTEMTRLMSPANFSMGAAGAYGYYDENLQTYIHTNKQRREIMRQQGVSEKGATPKNSEAWV